MSRSSTPTLAKESFLSKRNRLSAPTPTESSSSSFPKDIADIMAEDLDRHAHCPFSPSLLAPIIVDRVPHHVPTLWANMPCISAERIGTMLRARDFEKIFQLGQLLRAPPPGKKPRLPPYNPTDILVDPRENEFLGRGYLLLLQNLETMWQGCQSSSSMVVVVHSTGAYKPRLIDQLAKEVTTIHFNCEDNKQPLTDLFISCANKSRSKVVTLIQLFLFHFFRDMLHTMDANEVSSANDWYSFLREYPSEINGLYAHAVALATYNTMDDTLFDDWRNSVDRPPLEVEENFIARQALKAISDKLTERLNGFEGKETRPLRLIVCFDEPKKLDEIQLDDGSSVYDALCAAIDDLPAKSVVTIFISTVFHACLLAPPVPWCIPARGLPLPQNIPFDSWSLTSISEHPDKYRRWDN